MRETDSPEDPNVKKYKTQRQATSAGGIIVAIGGCVLAIWHKDLALYGLVAALIGAGLVDPYMLLRMVKK